MKYAPFLLALLLVGCGRLSGPSYGNSGYSGKAASMSQSPVLFVPSPTHALIDAKAASLYADDMVNGLRVYGVPSAVGTAHKRNWRLLIAAKRDAEQVIPAYHILGPNGEIYGKLEGEPVSAKGWEAGDPTVLSQTAARDSARLSKLLARINAVVQLNNPHALVNRTPLVFVGTVAGAPGDGNISLQADLTRALATSDLKLVPDRKDADFSITGAVKVSPTTTTNSLAEIDWTVRDSDGRLVGQVTQLRDLKTSALSGSWRDVAVSLAQEAASGVSTVVHNDIEKLRKNADQ